MGVRVADFNGDGVPDIIYGDFFVHPNVVHVMFGQTGGVFIAGPNLVLPASATAVCQPVDVNGDHKEDLVCPSYGPSSLLTFIGNGDGTFQSPIQSNIPNAENVFNSLYIYPPADLNGDGHADLIVSSSLNTYIMLGDGAGHFSLAYTIPASYDIGGAPSVVDSNGDGKLDLLFGGTTYFGNGDGTFTQRFTGGGSGISGACIYGDMDGDGHVDAVCGGIQSAYSNAPTVLEISHGNADGSFSPTPIAMQTFGSRTAPGQGYGPFFFPIAIADVNKDGILDIIANSDDGLAVLLGEAGLKFAAPVHYPVGYLFPDNGPFNTFVDVNNDGSPDVVASGPDGVYITYGHPDGTFDSGAAVESGDIVAYSTVADFNGDQIPDVATTGDATIKLSLGNGDGTFKAAVALPNGNGDFSTPNSPLNAELYHGDFNGDGKQDILAVGAPSSSFTDREFYILFGHGDGSFDSPVQVPTSSTLYKYSSNLTVIDLNKDGKDDVLTADTGVVDAFLSNGNGSFTEVKSPAPSDGSQFYAAPSTPIAAADFNHDGKLDVVVGGINHAYILLGNGDGSFAASAVTLPIPSSIGIVSNSIATGDFDGDGNQDVVLVNWLTTGSGLATGTVGVYVYYGNGDGTFSAPVTAGVYNQNYVSVRAADLNHDGISDLILASKNTQGGYESVGVVNAMAGRSFGPLTTYTAGSGLSSVGVADLNQDGFPDLVFSNGDPRIPANSFTVLLNVPGSTVTGTLNASPEPSVVGQGFTVTAGFTLPAGSNESLLSGPVVFGVDGATVGTASLANNTASVSVPGTLAIGPHQLTAFWAGDTNFPAVKVFATHVVKGLPVTLTVTSSLNPANLGQAVTLTTMLSGQSGFAPPTGTITLADNGTPVGNGNGRFNWTLFYGFSSAGQHTIVATYSGDATYAPATATLVETVNPVATASVLQGSPNPSVYGQPVTFTTSVAVNLNDPIVNLFLPPAMATLTGLPGGAVTRPVVVGSTTASTTTWIATYTTSSLPAGTYTVGAAYSGSVNTLGSAAGSIVQVVEKAPTTIALSAVPAKAYQTQTITLTAQVTGVGTPSGTVQFFDGSVALGTATLAGGSATFAAQPGVGTHSITAVYSGDTNDLGSTSAGAVVTILPSDFQLSLDQPTVTLVTGHHTTVHLSAASVGDFSGTVHLTVSTLPQWVTFRFAPTDVNVAGTSSIYLDTDAVIGYLSERRLGEGVRGGGAAVAIALVMLPVALWRRRRIASLLCVAVVLVGMGGCSGKYPDSTPPGTYGLQITGTSGSLTHSVTLTLVVQGAGGSGQ